MRGCCVLVAAALMTSACGPSLFESRRSVTASSLRARLYVPRLYAPLVPGSAYPNRRVPVPAQGRPGVLLVAPARLFARAAAPLAERGLVVLRIAEPADIGAAARWLAGRPECGGARIGVVLVEGVAVVGLESADVAALAVVGGRVPLGFPPGTPALTARIASDDSDLDTAPGTTVRKLYRAPDRFRAADVVPPEAWRDAAEWLAVALSG